MYIVSNITKNISEQGFLCKYNFIVPRCLCRNIIVDLQKFIFNLAASCCVALAQAGLWILHIPALAL